MEFGFVRVAAAVPGVKVADCSYNVARAEAMIHEAAEKSVQIIVFPELNITGYTCGDLFMQHLLIEEAKEGLLHILEATKELDIVSILGVPLQVNSSLLNCAVAIQSGKILGVVAKCFLPNYREFSEKRWFASAFEYPFDMSIELFGQTVFVSPRLIFQSEKVNFGIEICEDVWATIPPGSLLALKGADIVFNLSADTENVGKHRYLLNLLSMQSSQSISGYVFSSCGYGESTTDVVFAGHGLIYESGELLAGSKRFEVDEQLIISDIDVERLRNERQVNTTFASAQRIYINEYMKPIPFEFKKKYPHKGLMRDITPSPFIPKDENLLRQNCKDALDIQVMALATRLKHTRMERVVLGVSGGLDSTLALLACVHCFDKLKLPRTGIIGITMPGFGTSDRTYQNSLNLMKHLGIDSQVISIKEACMQHFKDIGHNPEIKDITYENVQARERTQILMDYANEHNALVIGTGDMSELALGWATYNGDQMSMYGVNAGIPKTMIRHIVEWYANYAAEGEMQKVLLDVVSTPISPELVPAEQEQEGIAQKTEDLVGPYDLHDFFLYYFIRYGFRPKKIFMLAKNAFVGKYDAVTIKHWILVFFRRFFAQQFKRSCLPDGPKVWAVSLSPRGDWRMPSDASATLWLKECEALVAE